MESAQSPSPSPMLLTDRRILTLEIAGLRNRRGVIYVALFASPDGYPNDPQKAVRSGSYPIPELPFSLEFADLPFGRYAATVHHDENADGKLNCNLLGIPQEGIGFSGNPTIWMGVPPFQRVAFDFTSDKPTLSITMKYLLP